VVVSTQNAEYLHGRNLPALVNIRTLEPKSFPGDLDIQPGEAARGYLSGRGADFSLCAVSCPFALRASERFVGKN
jgi:hypothetical protein